MSAGVLCVLHLGWDLGLGFLFGVGSIHERRWEGF